MDEVKANQRLANRNTFLKKKVKKDTKTVTVDPKALVFPATVLLAKPQNKVDDKGNPTGSFTYIFSPSHEAADILKDTPSQFHGNGESHFFEAPPLGHESYAILGLPSFCSQQTAADGLEEFTVPFCGPRGALTGKCPTEVRMTPFLPIKIKGVEAKSFYMKETVPKKKGANAASAANAGKGSAPSAGAAAEQEVDPDAPQVDEGNANGASGASGAAGAGGAGGAEEVTEFKKLYHMISIGSIVPYPDFGGVVYFGEFLQTMLGSDFVPTVWNAPDLKAPGAPSKNVGEARMQTWNADLRCLLMGPDMEAMVAKFTDKKLPICNLFEAPGSEFDCVERKVMIDIKKKTEGMVTCWTFPLEIVQDTDGMDEDEAPPEQVLHYVDAATVVVYAKFGVDDRESQRGRLLTVTRFVRNYMNGAMLCARDWPKTAALNGSENKIDLMSINNKVAKKLDGLTNDDVPITSYAWSLLDIKGDWRRVVVEHGIEVSRKYARDHFELIKKLAGKGARKREVEDSVAEHCQIEFGMMPISTETSNVGDYIPDKEGRIDVEEGGDIKVRYFVLNPGMIHSRGKQMASLISKYMKKDPKSMWGDHLVKLLSPQPVVFSKLPGCPKDLLELSAFFEGTNNYMSTDIMLYAVCYVKDFEPLDKNPLHCRRNALKILSHHYPFKPDFTWCDDKDEAVAASQAKKRKHADAKVEAKAEAKAEARRAVKVKIIDEDVPEPKKKKVVKEEKEEKEEEMEDVQDSEPEASADKDDEDQEEGDNEELSDAE